MDVPSNEGLVVLLLSKILKRKACSETSIFETVILDVLTLSTAEAGRFSVCRPEASFYRVLGTVEGAPRCGI
jgi:hypothetical protein